jgi:hypothetical protein
LEHAQHCEEEDCDGETSKSTSREDSQREEFATIDCYDHTKDKGDRAEDLRIVNEEATEVGNGEDGAGISMTDCDNWGARIGSVDLSFLNEIGGIL